MKFVFNTKNTGSAASLVCIEGLSALLRQHGHDAMVGDWEHYDRYDVAVFMAYDPQIEEARQQNPAIKIGLADPKPGSVEDARKADFLLVSSIEQRELFLPHNSNCFIYYMIPPFDAVPVEHGERKRVVLGYHGNKTHLDTFCERITPALEALGERFDIELRAVYNLEAFGRWTLGRPDPERCPVADLPWYENCYKDYFGEVDIGIVPNLYPIRRERFIKRWLRTSTYLYKETGHDHLVKYKFSTNAGRIFVFGRFGIPVVAEATPSAGDVLRDGVSGKLVLGAEGWYHALAALIGSAGTRRRMGAALREEVETRFDRERTAGRLLDFLRDLPPRAEVRLRAQRPFFWIHVLGDLVARAKRKLGGNR